MGGKTLYAIDAYAAAQPVAKAASVNVSGGGYGGGSRGSSRQGNKKTQTSNNNSVQEILNTPNNVKKLSDIRLQNADNVMMLLLLC